MRAGLQHQLRKQPNPAPKAWPQALNTALQDVLAAVEEASTSLAARWHWPPPECLDDGSAEGDCEEQAQIPPGWWRGKYADTLRRQLQAAFVGDVPPAEGAAGETSSGAHHNLAACVGLQW